MFANLAAPRSSEIRHLAMDGVSCTVCHQIRADNFGEEASFDGGFVIDTTVPAELRNVFGPHDVDGGRQRVMQSAAGFLPTESTHVQQSELCATCHTLFTTALDSTGRTIGSLAEQVPYLEWLHSSYRATNNCQSCHMPELGQDTPISSVLGQARPNFSQHTFRGANAFMLGILNRFRGELGVAALPQELEASIRRTRDHLQTSAAVISIDAMRRAGPTLAVDVAVSSLTGHKLPTAYPSRRVWIHLSVLDARGNVLFESGRVRDDGSIVGNDNDDDGTRYEPHYRTIVSGDQVQIYEPILVDSSDRVTTGLLTGVRYIKDNRILPRGFDKATAEEEVAVKGAAAADDDFQAGGDRVRYEIPIGDAGVLTVEAELLYESIGYRWATNLSRYDADEPRRFTRYYAASSSSSAIALAHAARSSD